MALLDPTLDPLEPEPQVQDDPWGVFKQVQPKAAKAKLADQYAELVRAEAMRQGVDPDFALSVYGRESGGNPKARSPKGAMGLMQLMPKTARKWRVRDPYNPVENVRAGVSELREQLLQFGSPKLGLAGYNAGPGAVIEHKGVPPYPETINYIANISPNELDDDPWGVLGPSTPQTDAAINTQNLAARSQQPRRAFNIPLGGFQTSVSQQITQRTAARLQQPQPSSGKSPEWDRMQADMTQRALAAGLPPASNSRQRLIDAINRVEHAGFKTPHFIGTPKEPTGDRGVTKDIENLVRSLKAQEAATQGPARNVISKQRVYWEQEAASGMTAQEWKRQTGEPQYPTTQKTWDGYPAKQNADGSVSSELSITVTDPRVNNGQPTNIPSLWKGRVLSQERAIRATVGSGIKFPAFGSLDEAVGAAQKRSRAKGQGRYASPEAQRIWGEFENARKLGARDAMEFQARRLKDQFGFEAGPGEGGWWYVKPPPGYINITAVEAEQEVVEGRRARRSPYAAREVEIAQAARAQPRREPQVRSEHPGHLDFLRQIPAARRENVAREIAATRQLTDEERAILLPDTPAAHPYAEVTRRMGQGLSDIASASSRVMGNIGSYAGRTLGIDPLAAASDELTKRAGVVGEVHGLPPGTPKDVLQGVGSSLPFFAAGGIPGLAGKTAAGLLGWAANAGSIYDEAIQSGATPHEALNAAHIAGPIGLTEMFGVGGSLGRAGRYKMIRAFIRTLLREAGEEGSQEAVQGALNNLIAKGLYDPKREVFANVGYSALIGAITGGALAGAGHIASRALGRDQASPPQKGVSDAETIRQDEGVNAEAGPVREGGQGASRPDVYQEGRRRDQIEQGEGASAQEVQVAATEAVQPETRESFHKLFGRVTKAEDQSGVRSGKERWIDYDGDEHVLGPAHRNQYLVTARPQFASAGAGVTETELALDDLINRPAARPTTEQQELLGVQPKEEPDVKPQPVPGLLRPEPVAGAQAQVPQTQGAVQAPVQEVQPQPQKAVGGLRVGTLKPQKLTGPIAKLSEAVTHFTSAETEKLYPGGIPNFVGVERRGYTEGQPAPGAAYTTVTGAKGREAKAARYASNMIPLQVQGSPRLLDLTKPSDLRTKIQAANPTTEQQIKAVKDLGYDGYVFKDSTGEQAATWFYPNQHLRSAAATTQNVQSVYHTGTSTTASHASIGEALKASPEWGRYNAVSRGIAAKAGVRIESLDITSGGAKPNAGWWGETPDSIGIDTVNRQVLVAKSLDAIRYVIAKSAKTLSQKATGYWREVTDGPDVVTHIQTPRMKPEMVDELKTHLVSKGIQGATYSPSSRELIYADPSGQTTDKFVRALSEFGDRNGLDFYRGRQYNAEVTFLSEEEYDGITDGYESQARDEEGKPVRPSDTGVGRGTEKSQVPPEPGEGPRHPAPATKAEGVAPSPQPKPVEAKLAEPEPAKPKPAQPEEFPVPIRFGSKNKIITRDDAAKLWAEFKESQRTSRGSGGLSAEDIIKLVKIGGFFVEGGARSLDAFTKRLVKLISSELGKDRARIIAPLLFERAVRYVDTGDLSELTGVKNAITDAERALRGVDPIEKQLYNGMGQAYIDGKLKAQDDPKYVKTLSIEIAKRPRPLTTTEIGALAYDQIRLKTDRIATQSEISRMVEEGQDPFALHVRLQEIEDDWDLNDQALERGGREQSAAFNARKLIIREDYDILTLLKRVRVNSGNKEVDPKLREQLETLATENARLTKALGTQEQRQRKAEEAAALKRMQTDATREVKASKRAITKKELDDEFEDLKKQFAAARKEAGGVSSAGFAGIDPEGKLTVLAGKMAFNRVKAGVNTIEALVDNVYAALQDQLEGFSKRDVRDALSGYGRDPKRRTKNEVTSELARLKTEMQRLSKEEDTAPERAAKEARDEAKQKMEAAKRKTKEAEHRAKEVKADVERSVREVERAAKGARTEVERAAREVERKTKEAQKAREKELKQARADEIAAAKIQAGLAREGEAETRREVAKEAREKTRDFEAVHKIQEGLASGPEELGPRERRMRQLAKEITGLENQLATGHYERRSLRKPAPPYDPDLVHMVAQRNRLRTQIDRIVAKQKKTGKWALVTSMRQSFALLNLIGATQDIISTTGHHGAVVNPAMIPAVMLDQLQAMFTNQRTMALLGPGEFVGAIAEGLRKVPREVREIAEHGLSAKQAIEQEVPHEVTSGSKATDMILNGTSRMRSIIDLPNYEVALEIGKRVKSKALAKTEALEGKIPRTDAKRRAREIYDNMSMAEQLDIAMDAVTASAKDEAIKHAKMVTFKNSNAISNATRRVIEMGPVKFTDQRRFVVRAVMMFEKAMTNYAKIGFDLSGPGVFLGLGRAMLNLAPFSRGWLKIHDTAGLRRSQNLANWAFARGAVGGAGAMGLGYILAGMGMIGDPRDDENKRKGRVGSFYIMDRSFDLGWLGPVAIPLAMGARAYHDSADGLIKTAKGMGQTGLWGVTQAPPVKGAAQVYNWSKIYQAKDPLEAVGTFLGRFAASFIPGIQKDVAKLTDLDEKGMIKEREQKGFVDQLTGAVPGLRQTLPERILDRGDLNRKVRESLRKGDESVVKKALEEGKLTRKQAEELDKEASMTQTQVDIRNMAFEKAMDVYKKASAEERAAIFLIIREKWMNATGAPRIKDGELGKPRVPQMPPAEIKRLQEKYPELRAQ